MLANRLNRRGLAVSHGPKGLGNRQEELLQMDVHHDLGSLRRLDLRQLVAKVLFLQVGRLQFVALVLERDDLRVTVGFGGCSIHGRAHGNLGSLHGLPSFLRRHAQTRRY